MNEIKTPEIEKEIKQENTKKPKYSRETTKDTPLKVRRRRCLKRIKEIIEESGPWSINISELSEEYFSDWETVKGWFNGFLKSLDAESIDNISHKGELMICNNLKKLEKMSNDADDKDKILAINASFKGLESYGNWLEKFGRKQKIADKLDINGEINNKVKLEIIDKTEDVRDDSTND